MSQRRPGPYPPSHRSSQSPPRDTGSAFSQQRDPAYRDDSTARPPHDPGGIPAGERGEGAPRRGSRTSGVHNILNPPGVRAPGPAASSPRVRRRSAETSPRMKMEQAPYEAGRPTEAGARARPDAGQLGPGSSPPRPRGLPGLGSMTPRQAQALPHAQSPADPNPSGSPQGMHPFAARRIATPKSRAASLSRAAMRAVEAQRLGSMPPLPAMTGLHAHDTSPVGGPAALATPLQFPGPIQPPGPAGPTPGRPTSSLSRSLSQPMMGHGLPPPASTQEQPPPANLSRDHEGRPVFSPNQPFATAAGPHRSMLGEAGGRWGQLPPGATAVAGRNLQLGGDGQQQFLTITPANGEELVIPVDFHQASKQADEKRQRNAGASARFRMRKKEKEAAQQEGLQKLENHNRELERRIEELESELEFYRNERNRLRELVLRTPGISEWADRPPSPAPSRGAGSYATENSPLPATAPPIPLPPPHPHSFSQQHALAHPHPPPSSYNDPSMMERPARRRRTDSDPPPQLGTPSYRPNTPASLPPPMPSAPSAYGVPSSPRLSTSPGTARLPPIRFEHAPSGPEIAPARGLPPTSTASSQPGQAGGYISYGKAPYESGWATEPRGPPEGGPR